MQNFIARLNASNLPRGPGEVVAYLAAPWTIRNRQPVCLAIRRLARVSRIDPTALAGL